MSTTTIRAAHWLVLSGVAVLMLAGCATPAPAELDPGAADPGTTDSSSDDSAGGDAASGPCPAVPQEGYELFSSDYVTAAPEAGAVYSASNRMSFTLSLGAGYTPGIDMSYVNDAGDAIVIGGQFLQDNGDGSYYQDLGIFDSDADGRPGFVTLTVLNDETFTPTPGDETFDSSTLGVYCVTFEVE